MLDPIKALITNLGILKKINEIITELVNHVTNHSNPHNVTAEQLGLGKVYKYKGSVRTYSELPTTDNKVGDTYNIEQADSAHNIKAGDNVAWTDKNTWDNLTGIIDTSNFAKLDAVNTFTKNIIIKHNEGNSAGLVVGYNNAIKGSFLAASDGVTLYSYTLNNYFMKAFDDGRTLIKASNLQTKTKEIIGAINELNTKIGSGSGIDTSNLAKLNAQNIFTDNQRVEGLLSVNDFLLIYKGTSGTERIRILSFDKDNLELNFDGAAFNASNISAQKITVSAPITEPSQAATKEYVDNKIGSGTDTTNLAKLDGRNDFSNLNIFRGGVMCIGTAPKSRETPIEDDDLVPLNYLWNAFQTHNFSTVAREDKANKFTQDNTFTSNIIMGGYNGQDFRQSIRLDATKGTIQCFGTPTNSSDLTPKKYVDSKTLGNVYTDLSQLGLNRETVTEITLAKALKTSEQAYIYVDNYSKRPTNNYCPQMKADFDGVIHVFRAGGYTAWFENIVNVSDKKATIEHGFFYDWTGNDPHFVGWVETIGEVDKTVYLNRTRQKFINFNSSNFSSANNVEADNIIVSVTNNTTLSIDPKKIFGVTGETSLKVCTILMYGEGRPTLNFLNTNFFGSTPKKDSHECMMTFYINDTQAYLVSWTSR